MTKKATTKKYTIEKPIVTMDDAEFIHRAALPPIENFTSVKHFPNLGDQIAVMPSLKKYYEVTGRKIKFLQVVGTPAAYYPGATHPTQSDGVMVTMNDAMFDMMKPLMESQEYIHSYEKYIGQKVDLDFDVIRGKTFVNLPHGMIQSWIMFAYPDLACDLSEPWIEFNSECPKHIKRQVSGKVVLNFTERYRNNILDYFFLKNHSPDLVFAGTEREHWLFCNAWQLNIPRLQVKNFLELGYGLKECRFVLSNQSFVWNLCQAMHTPRVLEVCNYAQNCMPFVGGDSYGYFHQVGAEYYFRMMMNKTVGK